MPCLRTGFTGIISCSIIVLPRPRNMVEMVLDNKVRYKEPGESLPTFREEIDRYAGICPWLIFGIDLALGKRFG